MQKWGLLCALLVVLGAAACGDDPPAPTCTDAVRNGGESDVDCGGPCAACADGRGCSSEADCVSGVCDDGVCVATSAAPTCADGFSNGSESDVDCGGGCPPCGVGRSCRTRTDCQSGQCVEGSCREAVSRERP